MRYVDEFRDPDMAKRVVASLHEIVTRPWTVMEICGGQTHAIVRYGIDELLPKDLELVHGPGCPVCVTPVQYVDKAIELAAREDVIFCSFGDMLRVPGTDSDLLSAKARGADVRIVYSPVDAVRIARENTDKQVLFFAVGFETTAPANAMAAFQAHREGVANFSMLVSHVLVPPAMEALLTSPSTRVQGFLAAGHVCTVMGYETYLSIAEKYAVPIVVTGFEPLDILQGLHMCVRQLEEGRAEVENQYARSVQSRGNGPAQELMGEVFRVVHRQWRGLGEIPQSGLALAPNYRYYDAEERFGRVAPEPDDDGVCISGRIMQGLAKPPDCPAFGTHCTPENPLGVTMVSSEGSCAAYHRYRSAVKTPVSA